MEAFLQISAGIAVLVVVSWLLALRIVRQRDRLRGDGSNDSWSGSSDMPSHDSGGWSGDSGSDSGGHGGH